MAAWHDAVLDPPKLTVKDPMGDPWRSEEVLTVFERSDGVRSIHIDVFTRAGNRFEWLYAAISVPGKVTHWMTLPKLPKVKGAEKI